MQKLQLCVAACRVCQHHIGPLPLGGLPAMQHSRSCSAFFMTCALHIPTTALFFETCSSTVVVNGLTLRARAFLRASTEKRTCEPTNPTRHPSAMVRILHSFDAITRFRRSFLSEGNFPIKRKPCCGGGFVGRRKIRDFDSFSTRILDSVDAQCSKRFSCSLTPNAFFDFVN